MNFPKTPRPWQQRAVQEVDKDGKVINEWPSLAKAAAAVGCACSNLCGHLRRKTPPQIGPREHGRYFRYSAPPEKMPEKIKVDWAPYASAIQRLSHHYALQVAAYGLIDEAEDYIRGCVLAALGNYPGRHVETTPEQWIIVCARYGALKYGEDCARNREHTAGEDDTAYHNFWQTAAAPGQEESIDDVLLDMPEDIRQVAELRWDGKCWYDVMAELGIGNKEYRARMDRLRQWLHDRLMGEE